MLSDSNSTNSAQVALARQYLEELVRRCNAERERLGDIALPIELDLGATLALIGNLQLALRQPGNRGRSAKLARWFIDGIIARLRKGGYTAAAEMAERGDDPRYDVAL